jgi:probable phosphoglycerate mutase
VEALLGLGADHRRVFGPLGNCNWSELSFQPPRWRLMRHNGTVPQPPGEPVAAGSDGAPRRSGADTGDALARAGATPDEAPATASQDADAAS